MRATIGIRIRCSVKAVICLGVIFFAILAEDVVGGRKLLEDQENEDNEAEGSGRSSTTYRPIIEDNFTCRREKFGNDSSLYWNESQIGEVAITKRPCILSNGLPLTRKCTRRLQTHAVWENVSKTPADCVTRTRENLITSTLAELEETAFVNKTLEPPKAVKRLKEILRRTGDYKLIPADVHYTARIIERAVASTKTPELCVNVQSILNRLMGADREILRATMFLSSTDSLLQNFESCVDVTSGQSIAAAVAADEQIETVNLSSLGVQGHLSMNLSVFHVDPAVANVSGIALYDKPANPNAPGMYREAFGDFYYRLVFLNETVSDLMGETGLEMATFVPLELWKDFRLYRYRSAESPARLIIKVYSNDALFVEPRLNTTSAVFSKVASLTVPGALGYYHRPLPIIFRSHGTKTTQSSICGYWNFGSWDVDGITVIQDNIAQNNLIACGTHHMTQFAYLIGGDYRFADFSDNVVVTRLHLRALDIITLVGCTLSILGLLGIFITSLVFKAWRSKASTKVLLHLSTAIIFQMILFCFVNTQDMTIYLMQNKDYGGCIALGALLQYSVLVEFTWMLIIAFLQFQRYVQVFGSRPDHFILKSALVGWGLPIIPPAILIAVDRRSYIPYYNRDSALMCYPSGDGLNYGVILPIALIIAANLVIFVMVLWNIRHTLEISSQRSERKMALQQIRLMVMMFFLFGFSWIFGLLAAMDAGLAFSYLFCITATLQGFVLFVYFVVLDPATRKLWYQICWNAESKQKSSEVAELGTTTG